MSRTCRNVTAMSTGRTTFGIDYLCRDHFCALQIDCYGVFSFYRNHVYEYNTEKLSLYQFVSMCCSDLTVCKNAFSL